MFEWIDLSIISDSEARTYWKYHEEWALQEWNDQRWTATNIEGCYSTTGNWFCTRPKDHRGPHMALCGNELKEIW